MWQGSNVTFRCHTLFSLILLSSTTVGLPSPSLRIVAIENQQNTQFLDNIFERVLQKWEFSNDNVTINYEIVSDTVDSGGFYPLVKALTRNDVHAVIGSVADHVCEASAALASFHKKLYISWGCPGFNTSKYRTFGRIVPPAKQIADSMSDLLHTFKWKYCILLATEEQSWFRIAVEVDKFLRSFKFVVKDILVFNNYSKEHIQPKLKRIVPPVKAIVMVMDMNSPLVKNILIIAHEMNLSDGRFAFFVLHALPTLKPGGPPRLAQIAPSMLRALFIITTVDWDISTNPDMFNNRTNVDFIESYVRHYDAISLLFAILKKTIEDKVDLLSSNTNLSKYLNRIKYPTLWGQAQTTENGDRLVRLLLYDYNPSYSEFIMLTELQDVRGNYWTQSIDWPGESPPTKDALCIFREEDCTVPTDDYIISGIDVITVTVPIVAFIIIALGIAAIVRKKLLYKEMRKKILMTTEDLVVTQQVRKPITKGYSFEKPDILRGSHDSLKPPTCLSSNQSRRVSTEENLNCARLNGDIVYLKYLVITSPFMLKRKAMQQLCTTYELRNENLNPFLGCLADSQRPALVWEYCSRGSLYDVLAREDIKLDWAFKLSLLTDLVRGMRYLHNSTVKCHGRLNSRNCIIDSRWVLKITDYALPAFFQCQGLPITQLAAKELLWYAPELLRNPDLMMQGSQAGDVYAFSIILQEVLVRGEPYSMLQLTPEEIIEKLKHPPPLIRPSVSKQTAPPEAINIMRQCWAELPDMRPDFNQINDQFKVLNHGKKINIVDTMFQMLEKYSNNLEDLIQERTVQLDEEKKKTEQLLHRMLPSTVAESLKLGLPVQPEKFEEVTIYFSDIVGFTTISAYSEPMEIVDLLNDLYTAFDSTINHYNVYKVETIGDAYMVVGGLPERIDDHADQIATMALDLLYVCGKFRIRHMPTVPLMLRIGLHTGPVVSGVVGLTMPRYCLFGDTVNTASRMESTSSAYRIHMSQTTERKLRILGGYQIEYRGKIELKGKGKHDTYWLIGKEGFMKELPTPPAEDGDNHGGTQEDTEKNL